MMIEPQVRWITAAPLWQVRTTDSSPPEAFVQPTILRFATDDFMDEYMRVVDHEANRLGEWEVQAETWEEPAPIPVPPKPVPPFLQQLNQSRLESASPFAPISTNQTPMIPASEDLPLKLFQPAHQRFYMVSASLVCRIQGLPDRRLDTSNGERTSFVVRRLRPKGQTTPEVYNLETCDEYAFVHGTWQKVTTADQQDGAMLIPGEDQLPLFGKTYQADDGRKRRLLSGMIPVGRRQEYVGVPFTASPTENNGATQAPLDGRISFFDTKVTSPWRSLLNIDARAVENIASVAVGIAKADSDEEIDQIIAENDAYQDSTDAQKQEISWYILLDFSAYLQKYLENVWNYINGEDVALSTPQELLATHLETATYDGMSLADALIEIEQHRTTLESVVTAYTLGSTDFPSLEFLLTDTNISYLVDDSAGIDLNLLIINALPAQTTKRVPQPDITAKQAQQNREPAWFVIRCCFERPNCTPVFLPLVSDPTTPFQMASFFDPDAPVRSIRIPMPLDTTPAGLRKFAKGAAFEMSNKLCAQVEHAKGMTLGDLVLSVLPWPFHKNLPSPDKDTCDDGGSTFGMICSLSIPIVTIAALILLLIIVSLFDIIFKWLPYLFVCLPIPGLDSKDNS